MKKIGLVFIIFAISLFSVTVFAKASLFHISDQHVRECLTINGASYQLDGNKLYIWVNYDEIKNRFDDRIKAGFYNRFAMSDYWNTKKTTESNYAENALYSTIAAYNCIIPRVYHDHPNLDNITVFIGLSYPSNFGNNNVRPITSWSINRNKQNQLDWDKVDYKS